MGAGARGSGKYNSTLCPVVLPYPILPIENLLPHRYRPDNHRRTPWH
jgi:hypothetical protein